LSGRLRLALVLLCLAGPLGTDIYLPSLPRMAGDLHAGVDQVQLTFTTFLLGLGTGQLLIGPLSDRFGRRRPMLVFALAATLAGVLCAVAPAIGPLIGFRFVQGLCGGAGVVLSRAIITDLTRGTGAVRAFSVQTSIIVLVPIIAPLLGGSLGRWIGWRGVFGLLVAVALAGFAAAMAFVPESLPPEARQRGIAGFGVLLRRPFLLSAATHWSAFAAFMAYLSASSLVVQRVLHLTDLEYAAAFAANAVGFALCANVNARIVGRAGPERMLRCGLAGLLTGSLMLCAVGPLARPPVALMLPAMWAAVASVGFILPNATALTLAQARSAAGTGAATLGAGQYLLGAAATVLVAAAGGRVALGMGAVMLLCACLANVLIRVPRGTARPTQEQVNAG
jgi:DHA1 family bicyclomycin/chloramphenicol resistance-like MFS transporter